MTDFLPDNLKYKETPPNYRKKSPTITIFEILHTFIGVDINIRPIYPKHFCLNFFLVKSMALKYLT